MTDEKRKTAASVRGRPIHPVALSTSFLLFCEASTSTFGRLLDVRDRDVRYFVTSLREVFGPSSDDHIVSIR